MSATVTNEQLLQLSYQTLLHQHDETTPIAINNKALLLDIESADIEELSDEDTANETHHSHHNTSPLIHAPHTVSICHC